MSNPFPLQTSEMAFNSPWNYSFVDTYNIDAPPPFFADGSMPVGSLSFDQPRAEDEFNFDQFQFNSMLEQSAFDIFGA